MSGTVGTQNMGPVSNDILQLSNRFAARGHEVTLVDLATPVRRELLRPEVELLEVPGVSGSHAAARTRETSRLETLLRSWRNYLDVVRRIASHPSASRSDVVHFHSSEPLFIAQKMYGLRTFYTSHTPVWSMAAQHPRSLLERFDAWVERQAIRDSCLTIALGDYLTKAVPNAEITTIPNGIDPTEWEPIDRCKARCALGIDQRAFVVLFVGRIAPVKGVDTLLDAVRSLSHTLPTLQVLVIGSLSGAFDTRDDRVDAYAQRLLDAANGLPLQFLGFISNRTIEFRRYLASADITVVPSRHEPQGNVVLESLVMGTPVIGSDTGGIPDMVSDDVGYLFPPGDATALAARIQWAHDHPNELLKRRSRARASVVAHFSWDDVADRYLAAFHKQIHA